MAEDVDTKITDLLAQLIALANQFPHSAAISGMFPLMVALTPRDSIAIGVLMGSQFHSSLQIQVKAGLPMGRYRIGLFVVPTDAKPPEQK